MANNYQLVMTDELSHHGISGQKWGKKNGPPYPLDYKDLSAEEKKEAKSKAIRQGNIREAAKNLDEFTDQELRQLKDRFYNNKDIRDLSAKDAKTLDKNVDKIIKVLNKSADLSGAGIRLYNYVANTVNAFSKWDPQSGKLPIVGGGGGNNNKKKDNNKK